MVMMHTRRSRCCHAAVQRLLRFPEGVHVAAVGLVERLSHDLAVMPATLMSICSAVMPLSVPVTLESMSPSSSSAPAMSDGLASLPSSRP